MADYSYTARNPQEQIVKGMVSAASREAAMQTIQKQGLKPILVKQEGVANSFNPNKLLSLGGGKVKTRDLVIFTRQLSTMVSAGVPIVGALDTLRNQTESKKFKVQLEGIVKDVQSGLTLADSFAKYPSTFSLIYINMVRAGETGGILDDILKKLAEQQEKDASIRAKVKSATTYPLVLLGITVIAFFILTIFVVPKIGDLVTNLGGPNSKLPPQTAAMMAVSKFMRHQWYLIVALFIGGPIFISRWRKTPNGRKKFDAILLKIPIIKVIITKVAIARFARIFAALMGAGVSVLEALEVTAGAIGNSVIEKELLNAAKEVKGGKQLSQPLSQSDLFPPIVSQMLKVGEETGQIDTILVKVADFYEEEVDSVVNSLSSILEPIMICVMGAMVGLIAASVLGPITSLNQNIGE
jgi:type IV pilus assembly protein PilC